jgi:flagellar basal-body rod protein FlgB
MKYALSFIMSILFAISTPLIVTAEDSTTKQLLKKIDYLQNRHEILAQNIANVSTPKYITKDLETPDSLESKAHKIKVKRVSIRTTNPHHFSGANKNHKYSITLDKKSPMKANKNNVDITKQVTNIAQNSDETSTALKNYRSAMDLISAASGTGGQ